MARLGQWQAMRCQPGARAETANALPGRRCTLRLCARCADPWGRAGWGALVERAFACESSCVVRSEFRGAVFAPVQVVGASSGTLL
eukprot:689036-Prymnesium_polylepis.1